MEYRNRNARVRLLVCGVVQGVGFRPYVYRLARQIGLVGFVQNTPEGAVLEVEGDEPGIASFRDRLASEAPPLVRIFQVEVTEMAHRGDHEFCIVGSEASGPAVAWVPPDVATCADCLREMNDPANRRFEYPFINCTNCGPRYSILLDLPYDRPQTTMSGFEMCADCLAEYRDPDDRRFHAQPNACPKCGPTLRLVDACGRQVPVHGSRAIIEMVVNLLRSGGIVAWKGLGGYQLACDATNEAAVAELRRRKHRSGKAFAVMVADIASAESLCVVSEQERALLSGASKPIVLLPKRAATTLAPGVAPDSATLGLMLPYTPLHALLFRVLVEKTGRDAALVTTSGNRSEEPIAIDDQSAYETLKRIADFFVQHNRPIHTRVDDSVTRIENEREIVIRRARGYAPAPMPLRSCGKQLLACGAQQKNTFCLAKGDFAVLSQHIGDLENYETLVFFEETLARMKRLFQVEPEVVVHDLHPDYLSTQFARRLICDRHVGVQHHHAHIASCMAEHGLAGPVIGIAWDGTGFGTDGTIWGGEFLVADLAGFERAGYLRKVPLSGGDAAVREPWRVAYAYVHDAFGEAVDTVVPRGIRWQNIVPESSVRMLHRLLTRRVQTVETSSCGRLFDAVASLAGLHQVVSYEGQAAIALETVADDSGEAYDFTIQGQEPFEVDMREMIRTIVDEIGAGLSPGTIAAKFHNTMVAVLTCACTRMREATGLARVCLGGGCFQNRRLLSGAATALQARGFEVFSPQRVPCNDGGIALGQAAVAGERLRRGA